MHCSSESMSNETRFIPDVLVDTVTDVPDFGYFTNEWASEHEVEAVLPARKDVTPPSTPLAECNKGKTELPFDLDQDHIQALLADYLDEVGEVGQSTFPISTGELDRPLAIDGSRMVWARLTNVHSKRVLFEGSSVQRETVSIVRTWTLRLKNQPSWSRPVSIQNKKNRDSIGPAIFGWGRTDIPVTPRTPQSAFGKSFESFMVPRQLRASEDDANSVEFDEFVSAPPLSLQPPEAADASVRERPPKLHSPAAATSSSLLATVVPTSKPLDTFQIFDIATTHRQEPSESSEDASHATKMQGKESAMKEKGIETSHQADPWDFSTFEQQQHDKTSEMQVLKPKSVGRSRGESRTKKEIEDQATIARVLSLLPNIEYLLA